MKYDRISGNVTERARAEEAAPVLADVLASSLDSEMLLESVARPTSRQFRRKKMNLESKVVLSRYAVEHGLIE